MGNTNGKNNNEQPRVISRTTIFLKAVRPKPENQVPQFKFRGMRYRVPPRDVTENKDNNL